MNPEIKRYLDENGATYTPDALRRGLVEAGHDSAEVDAALREWEAQATDPASVVTDRRRFWLLAVGLHAGVLVLIAIASLVIGSFATGAWWLLVVLAVALLIGLGISGLIGRGSVQSGLTAALVLPAISALLIGGSCLALGGSYLLRAPPRTGVMDLHIESPLSFDGSGVARCDNFGGNSSFVVWADDLGRLDGGMVSVSLDSSDSSKGPVPTGPSIPNLNITLYAQGTDQPVGYSPIFSTRIELDASPDGRSGTLRFEGLEPGLMDKPPGQVPDLESISGTVTWTCT